MANPAPEPSGEDTTPQAYAALEKLYSEGRWSEVEVASQSLLETLPWGGDWGARVVLLLGHTRLYGFADPEGAATHYKQVLGWCEAGEGSNNSSEALQANPEALAILKSIAAAGLAQCQPEPTDLRPEPAPTLTASLTSSPTPPLSASQEPMLHATPWLAETEHQPQPGSTQATPSASTPTMDADNALTAFVQPVQIAETPEIKSLPPITDHYPLPREATPANVQPPPNNQLQPLAPEEETELGQGLLRVVVRAN